MIERRKFLRTLAGALGAVAMLGVGSASDARARHADMVPLSQILPEVRDRVSGRVMSARLRGSVYYIRILTRRGAVVEVRADGHTGRVLGVDRGVEGS